MSTPTLRLSRLRLQAFRSFVEPAELELPQAGLHQVAAPSGHGKSSLVEAIAFALDYSQFPATEHQSWPWLTEEPMSVDLDFSVGEQQYGIRRGKKPHLRIGAPNDNPVFVASASTIAKKLPEVLGMKPEMLKALTYRPQRQRGLFLSFTDAEKKSFLTELLHLGQAEAEADRTQKLITALERDLLQARARAEQAAASVPPEPEPPQGEETFTLRGALGDAAALAKTTTEKFNEVIAGLQALKAEQRRNWADQADTFESAIDAQQTELSMVENEQYRADPDAAAKLEKLKSRLRVVQDGIRKLRAQHQTEVALARECADHKKRTLWDAEQRAAEFPKLVAQRNTLLEAIDVLKVAVCPTCRQSWVDPTAKNLLNEKTAQAEVLYSSIESAEHHQASLDGLRAEVETVEQAAKDAQAKDPVPEKFYQGEREYQELVGAATEQQKTARATFEAGKLARVATQRAQVRELQARRSAAESEALRPTSEMLAAEQDVERLGNEMHDVQIRELEAKGRLDAAVRTNRMLTENFERTHAQWERLRDAERTEAAKVEQVERRLNEEQDLLGFIRSFLSLVFDETLQAVAVRANDLLAGVPNVAGFTLDFVSERETKAGTVRQEIKPAIRKDGHEISLRSGCSGGQQAVVELATDLALAQVIGERTAVFPGWLVLDEPFDGLGPQDKEACMAVLARVAEERAVFVIDHDAQVAELFDSVIALDYRDGRSAFA